jgi:hypothetical protein
MAEEDTVLEEAMDNLKEAGQRIRAAQSLMRSQGMTEGENHRDLLTRLSTALAMTETAYLHGRTGERVSDDLDHDGKPFVIVLLDGENAEVGLDPATLVEITPEEERPRITAYDVQIEVRHAGESTYAEGWVVFGGERHHLIAAASSSERGATYILDGETHWWSEIRWLDEWFEELWMEAAAGAEYSHDTEIDFEAHMRSEERSGE